MSLSFPTKNLTVTGSGGSPFSPVNSIPYVYNFDPAKNLRYRAARGKTARGLSRTRIGYAGDSRPQSYLADTGGDGAVWAMDAQLARMFTAAGIKAGYQCAFGNHATTNLNTEWDGRVDQGTFHGIGPYGFGGEFLETNVAGTYSFGPADENGATVSTNQCIFYYATYVGAGSFSMQADSGTAQTVSMNANAGLSFNTLSAGAPVGLWKANFVSAGAGGIYVQGFECFDNSGDPEVTFMNLGWTGSRATSWADTSNGWQPAGSWGVINLDMLWLGVGANDRIFDGKTDQQVGDLVNTIIGQIKGQATTDIIGLGYPPVKETDTFYNYTFTYKQQEAFDNMLMDVYVSNGLPYVSYFQRNGANYEVMNSLNLMADALHENGPGYAVDAALQFQMLSYT